MFLFFFSLFITIHSEEFICGYFTENQLLGTTFTDYKIYTYGDDGCYYDEDKYVKARYDEGGDKYYITTYEDADCSTILEEEEEIVANEKFKCTKNSLTDLLTRKDIVMYGHEEDETSINTNNKIPRVIITGNCKDRIKYEFVSGKIQWKQYVDDLCQVSNPVFEVYQHNCNEFYFNEQLQQNLYVKCQIPSKNFYCGEIDQLGNMYDYVMYEEGKCYQISATEHFKIVSKIENGVLTYYKRFFSSKVECLMTQSQLSPTEEVITFDKCLTGDQPKYDGKYLEDCEGDLYHYFTAHVCSNNRTISISKHNMVNVTYYNNSNCSFAISSNEYSIESECTDETFSFEDIKVEEKKCSKMNINSDGENTEIEIFETEQYYTFICEQISSSLYQKMVKVNSYMGMPVEGYQVYQYADPRCTTSISVLPTFYMASQCEGAVPDEDVLTGTKIFCIDEECKEGHQLTFVFDVCYNGQKYTRGDDAVILNSYASKDTKCEKTPTSFVSYPNNKVYETGSGLVKFSYEHEATYYCDNIDFNIDYTTTERKPISSQKIGFYLNECVRLSDVEYGILIENDDESFTLKGFSDSICSVPTRSYVYLKEECTTEKGTPIAEEIPLFGEEETEGVVRIYYYEMISKSSYIWKWDIGSLIPIFIDTPNSGTNDDNQMKTNTPQQPQTPPSNETQPYVPVTPTVMICGDMYVQTSQLPRKVRLECQRHIRSNDLIVCAKKNRDTQEISSYYEYILNVCERTSKTTSELVYRLEGKEFTHYIKRKFIGTDVCGMDGSSNFNFTEIKLSNKECQHQLKLISYDFSLFHDTVEGCKNYEKDAVLLQNIRKDVCANKQKYVEDEGEITLYQYETEDCTGQKVVKTYQCNKCNSVDGEYVQAVCPQYDSSYLTMILLSLLLILLI